MPWVNDLMNNDSTLNDKDIASDLITRSKTDISSIAKAVTETSNPQLRQILGRHLNDCINEHYRLSDMAITKNWYKAYMSPEKQVSSDYQASQRMT